MCKLSLLCCVLIAVPVVLIIFACAVGFSVFYGIISEELAHGNKTYISDDVKTITLNENATLSGNATEALSDAAPEPPKELSLRKAESPWSGQLHHANARKSTFLRKLSWAMEDAAMKKLPRGVALPGERADRADNGPQNTPCSSQDDCNERFRLGNSGDRVKSVAEKDRVKCAADDDDCNDEASVKPMALGVDWSPLRQRVHKRGSQLFFMGGN